MDKMHPLVAILVGAAAGYFARPIIDRIMK